MAKNFSLTECSSCPITGVHVTLPRARSGQITALDSVLLSRAEISGVLPSVLVPGLVGRTGTGRALSLTDDDLARWEAAADDQIMRSVLVDALTVW